MDIKSLSTPELRRLLAEARKEIDARNKAELIDYLVANVDIKRYHYIIFANDYDDNMLSIGFSSAKEGYIDDHVDENFEDVYHTMIDVADLGFEATECTYDLEPSRRAEVEALLQKIGVMPMKAEWPE